MDGCPFVSGKTYDWSRPDSVQWGGAGMQQKEMGRDSGSFRLGCLGLGGRDDQVRNSDDLPSFMTVLGFTLWPLFPQLPKDAFCESLSLRSKRSGRQREWSDRVISRWALGFACSALQAVGVLISSYGQCFGHKHGSRHRPVEAPSDR
jgi:hypothetical protein